MRQFNPHAQAELQTATQLHNSQITVQRGTQRTETPQPPPAHGISMLLFGNMATV
jgi:hypothetical protein